VSAVATDSGTLAETMTEATQPTPPSAVETPAPTVVPSPDGATPVVTVENVAKTYKLYRRPLDRLMEGILRRPLHRDFPALSGVSFQIPAGQGFGLVGENGAGKSTLLKILAGIAAPSAGRVEVQGPVASILELGSAFHPDFTGRQNISLNAAMLGLGPAEVAAKTPEIIEFSELGDFIDRPVKTYSTGMAMRLGFSIATQVEPRVLIIDEALSVGDGYFQKKCMDRLERYLGDGGTLLLCSHAMYYISAFCDRGLWMRHGRVEALGGAAEVVREYEHFLLGKSERAARAEAAAARPSGPSGPQEVPEPTSRAPARLVSADIVPRTLADGSLERHAGPRPPVYAPGESLSLEIAWEARDPDRRFHLGVGLNRSDGVEVVAFSSHQDGLPVWTGSTRYRVRLTLPEIPLVKGRFTAYVYLLDESALHIYDQELLREAFEVASSDYTFGIVRVPHRWDSGPDDSTPASPEEARP
jgi:lipopolysaccharide transport system ATP-binding protein